MDGEREMVTMRFNAINYANKLKNARDANEMAEIQAEELSEIINNDVALKQDILILDTKLSNEIKNIKNEMVIKLGSLVIGCTFIISLMIGILGFLLHNF